MKIGFIRKLVLKLITKFQEVTIKDDDRSMYMRLTKLHFKIYFRKSLVDAALNNTREFQMAADRHANMVMILVLGRRTGKKSKTLQSVMKNIKNAFQKDLLLEVEL